MLIYSIIWHSGVQYSNSVTYTYICICMYVCIHIHTVLFRFSSLRGYYKLLTAVSFATQ